MAAQLFRLAISSSSTTTAKPTITNYFNKLTAAITTANKTISSTKFQTNTGGAVTANLVTAASSNGYTMLFVNGALQQSSLYEAAASGVTITVPAGTSISVSALVTLSVVNFAPSTTTTITS